MMKKRLLLVAIAIVNVSACTTIYFENDPVSNPQTKSEVWHHNFALALYEASEPVNLDQKCSSGRWNSVKTETSFINGLAGGAVNALGPVWYPKTVEVTCK